MLAIALWRGLVDAIARDDVRGEAMNKENEGEG